MLKNKIKLLKQESDKFGAGYFVHESYNYRTKSALDTPDTFNVNHFFHDRPQSVQDKKHWYSGPKVQYHILQAEKFN